MGTTMNITVSAEGGAILDGTTRDDAQAIKALGLGWRWSRTLKAWYLPRTMRDETVAERVRQTTAALGATVILEAVETGAARLQRLETSALDRAEAHRAKAEQARAEANARGAKADTLAAMIPFGQPVLTDHYSAKRHRNGLAEIRADRDRSVATAEQAEHYERAAVIAEAAASAITDPMAALKRVDAIDTELRLHALDERRRERLLAERSALEGLAATATAAVATRDIVAKGDIIRWGGERACVLRVSAKTVSVGHWTYGTGIEGVRYGPVDRPLVPLDPETGKLWKCTHTVRYTDIVSVERDGVVVFERSV